MCKESLEYAKKWTEHKFRGIIFFDEYKFNLFRSNERYAPRVDTANAFRRIAVEDQLAREASE